MSAEPRFLTVQECADLVRVSTQTIYRWIAENRIPSIRIGDTVRVPARWRDKVLAAAESGPSTDDGRAAQ